MNLAWYLARACGLVAWALLFLAVTWGLLVSTRLFRSRPRPAWTLDLHRFLGGFAVFFTVLHVAALVADTYVHFGLAEILVPLASRWHPVAVAWGVVSLYLLGAVEGSSLLMRKLSNRSWKRIHRTSFGLFVFASIHASASGTDLGGHAQRAAALFSSGLVVFLWLLRIVSAKGARTRPAQPARGTSIPDPVAAR